MTTADPVAVAATFLSAPHKPISANNMRAICRALVDAAQVPQISNELAEAIRTVIATSTRHDTVCRDIAAGQLPPTELPNFVEERSRALADLCIRFQEEFPDV